MNNIKTDRISVLTKMMLFAKSVRRVGKLTSETYPKFIFNQRPLTWSRVVIFCLFLIGSSYYPLFAESTIWSDTSEASIATGSERLIVPDLYRTVSLDWNTLYENLNRAPKEGYVNLKNSEAVITLPLPDGKFDRFQIIESPIMAPGLAAKFPEIKTYSGQGIDDRTAALRFDLTPTGFHAMIISGSGTVYIDPYCRGDRSHYISYYTRDFRTDLNQRLDTSCEVIVDPEIRAEIAGLVADRAAGKIRTPSGEELRTYRLAVAATGEYTNFHGGTVEQGMAAIVTAMNRVTGIYELEVAVRLELIPNNDLLVYTNPSTDPYDNNDSGAMIGQNQANIDAIIGNGNYDIGHVFSTGGGGLASLGVVCRTGQKARGVTGISSPIGDPFYVDYVAHEMGHQFSGRHSFNGNTGSCADNRSGPTAYEPGSGSTIMAYAGICSPQDLQNHSDPYFHVISFDEIISYTTQGSGNNCPVITDTGNNPPLVDAGQSGYTIPIETPFTLTGMGIDVDSDTLLFCWEQFDLGPAGHPNTPSGNAPIFRSFNPVPDPSRTFPKILDIINNTQTMGEILPTYSRQLTFRLVARDNRAGGGGVDYASMTMNVSSSAGPFLVTTPNSAITWPNASLQEITWDVANTDGTPVNCAAVNILLSTDGGLTFPETLTENTPNDGAETVFIPEIISTTARIKVEAVDNVFFDMSNEDFGIAGPDFELSVTPTAQTVCIPGEVIYDIQLEALYGFDDVVALSVDELPAGAAAEFSENNIIPPGFSQLTISVDETAQPGNYDVAITGISPEIEHSRLVQLDITESIPAPVELSSPPNESVNVSIFTEFSWLPALDTDAYDIEIALDPAFTAIFEAATGISETNYRTSTRLESDTNYYWRVRADNDCGTGDFSMVFSFLTGIINCTTYYSTDVPLEISGIGAPLVTSSLNITDDVDIFDLNIVGLNGTHTRISDLLFVLVGPSGSGIALIDQVCDDEDDFDLSLDDFAPPGDLPCPPTDGGIYQPQEPLADFIGQNSAGTWRLLIRDLEDNEGGQLNGWGLEICTSTIIDGVIEDSGPGIDIPPKYSLSVNYPNPFNPSTTICYALPRVGTVSLKVYNSVGQIIKTLVDDERQPGYYQIDWDGTNQNGLQVASGIYFYRIQADNFSKSRKMILLK